MTSNLAVTDAERFLVQFHRNFPGCTSQAFAQSRTTSGDSVYDLLVKAVPLGARVLDLGCGDGYLLEQLVRAGHAVELLCGIDLSTHELAQAAARPALEGVALHHSRAAALPLAPQSVDVVVSNLVLMLLTPVEPVIEELARVLVPGGHVHAIVGGGPRIVGGGDAAEIFVDELSTLSRGSKTEMPRLGDRRIRNQDGLAQVFTREVGFSDLRLVDHYVSQSASFEPIWQTVSTVYERALIDDEDLAVLRERFYGRCEGYLRAKGTIPCSWAMRHFSATKL